METLWRVLNERKVWRDSCETTNAPTIQSSSHCSSMLMCHVITTHLKSFSHPALLTFDNCWIGRKCDMFLFESATTNTHVSFLVQTRAYFWLRWQIVSFYKSTHHQTLPCNSSMKILMFGGWENKSLREEKSVNLQLCIRFGSWISFVVGEYKKGPICGGNRLEMQHERKSIHLQLKWQMCSSMNGSSLLLVNMVFLLFTTLITKRSMASLQVWMKFYEWKWIGSSEEILIWDLSHSLPGEDIINVCIWNRLRRN